jgi:pimeloyl-ACP methyl ester carboxylesterase
MMPSEKAVPTVTTVRVRDGMLLRAAHYAPRSGAATGRPLLCLPGLTRNGRDFTVLAEALAADADRPRAVYTLDARGRGHSQWDSDWKNYTVPTEAQDVVDVMAALSIHGAAILGTSRGGLVAMVLGAIQPTAFGPVILNDIGPRLEGAGLARIAGYVGHTPLPATWEEAARQAAGANRSQFPNVGEAEWLELARQWFNDADGRPAPGYDPGLGKSVAIGTVPPDLWPQFMTLSKKPALLIRGAKSDLLSAATAQEMVARHARLALWEVGDEGHAPLLRDGPTLRRIADFLKTNET